MSQTVDLIIDGAVFLDVGIRMRNVRFRLVIIVIGYKVFHRVFRKEFLELAAQLCGQRLVMSQNDGRFLYFFNDLCHGVRLPGTGHTKHGLFLQTQFHSLCQRFDGFRLITGGNIFTDYFKLTHNTPETIQIYFF